MNMLYKTGIPGLDEVMKGGFLRDHSVMIEGYTGTGKTVLGMSLVNAGATACGESCVYVTFEELPEIIYRDAASLGFDFRALEQEGKLRVIFVSPMTLVEEITSQLGHITQLIEEIGAQRLYLDGINMIGALEPDQNNRRRLIERVLSAFRREGLAVMFSREKSEAAGLGASVESYIADTVIQLYYTQQHNRRIRYLEVVKSRGQDTLNGLHTFIIGQGGVTIYPRQKVPDILPMGVAYGTERLTFAVPALDEMLGGGVFRRSSTLIAGSAGTGKSMLCLQFVMAGARAGDTGLYVTLDESAEQVVANARALAPDAEELFNSERLHVMALSPLETDINQQIVTVRDVIKKYGVKRLAFDSLSNYDDVLAEGEYKDYVYALVAFIKGSGVTSLFTTEIHELGAVERVTSHGSSYLLDNVIMLRFVELANSLRRAIVVLKTRGSDHANDIREYEISSKGIEILPIDSGILIPVLSIQQYSHILTNFPTPRGESSQETDTDTSKES